MASASRPNRKSARISSPFPRKLNGEPAPVKESVQEKESTFLDRWVEPPLRPPVPSFMDHKGLERVGVLENMMPLGTMPNAKVKAKAKADPHRKSVQLRKFDGLPVESARATPEMTPATERMRSRSRQAEEANPSADHKENEQATGQENALETRRSRSRSQRASLQAISVHSTPSSRESKPPNGLPMSLRKAFDKAFERTRRDSTESRTEILQQLFEESLRDPNLTATLTAIATSDSVEASLPEFEQQIKALKKKIRPNLLSPQKQSSVSSQSPSRIISSKPANGAGTITLPATQNGDQALHQSTESPSPHSKSPIKISFTNGILPTTEATTESSPPEVADTATIDAMPTLTLSRRSSSSSLSSVNEDLAERPLPALRFTGGTLPRRSANQPRDSRSANSSRASHLHGDLFTLKRSSAEAGLLPSDQDEAIETKRRKFGKSFDDYTVKDSNVRRPPHTLRLSRAANIPESSSLEANFTLRLRNSTANGDLISPASDTFPRLSADLSGQTTPVSGHDRPAKRPKTAARIKMSPVKKKSAVVAGVVRPEHKRGGSVGYDDNSESSDNNDYCSACGGSGFLLCCDGCDRSFHFTCLDPPLDQDAALDEPWFCYICQARHAPVPAQPRGLFAEMLQRIAKKNPTAFFLPEQVREYFEGVRTGDDGEYEETSQQKPSTRGRIGYDEQPDFQKLKDAKGNTILCYKCGKSSLDHRDIIPCDYCTSHWHLDCLDPPLANPPNRSGTNGRTKQTWMCPAHVDHDLRHLDPVEKSGVNYEGPTRTHRVRRPKHAKIIDTAMRRGFANNGLIEIDDASTDEDGWSEDEYTGIIRRLPRLGIKLDFIDKVKRNRATQAQADAARMQAAAAATAELELSNAQATAENQALLKEDLRRRSFLEQKTALNLAQFASSNSDLDLGPSEVEILINALTAEAPADVVSKMTEGEVAAAVTKSAKPSVPLSPPSSDQHDSGISEKERNNLLRLQELIRRKLEAASGTSS